MSRKPLIWLNPVRATSTAAMATAAGAVACGVCCVLPFALPAVATAGVGSTLAWLGGAHWWVTGAATGIVGIAWVAVAVQGRRTRMRPARATLLTMGIATAALFLAIVWPRIEPAVIRLLRGQ